MRKFILIALVLGSFAGTAWAVDQLADPHHAQPDRRDVQEPRKMDCLDCHACDHPTQDDPCLAACPRHSDHFYGDHKADEGPDIVIIDQLANLYKPVIFSHKLHATMSNMVGGCENCHHYSEQSGVIPPCRECHDPDSNEVSLGQPALKGAYHRQCINCHRDWGHENACGFCHGQSDGSAASAVVDSTDIIDILHPMITATPTYVYETTYKDAPLVTFHHEDHVEKFGQACVDCHRGDSCKRCHDTGTHERVKFDHVTTCNSCHMERDCNFCHATTTQPRFEHAAATGWDLAPYHTGKKCSVCHGNPDSFRTPSHTCTDCHIHWEVGSFNHRVTGLALSENHVDLDCDNCHQNMDMTKPPVCTDCHDDMAFPADEPGERVRR